jgi:hypothetical protein
MPNKKHGIPRLPSGRHFSFSRNHFLSGKIHTFFGPEQKITAVNNYSPPARWPAAGSLLRVPQVVWLTAYFPLAPFGFTPTYDLDVFDFSPPFHTPYTVPNHFYEEATRLLGVFGEAKDAIEGVRKNKTFVSVTPIFDLDIAGYKLFFVGPNTNYVQVQAPAADADDFFGTDFLHICAGDVGVAVGDSYESTISESFPYRNGGFFFNTPSMDSFLASDGWVAAAAQIAGSYDKFRRYAAMLFPHNLDWSDWPSDIRNPPHPWSATYTPFPGLQLHTASNQLLTARIASELADVGFSMPGTSDEVTADSLVALIAEHYGFDPSTGDDLPAEE